MPDHAASIEELVVAADHAMYASKQTGRNRVSIASE
jgi:PleD family two-component response regulator